MSNDATPTETQLLDELAGAAYDDRPRAHELCALLFGAAEIADNPALAYTVAMIRQSYIGRRDLTPPYPSSHCITWRNGSALDVDIPTDPHERRFPHRH
jgi:hypothetical protein